MLRLGLSLYISSLSLYSTAHLREECVCVCVVCAFMKTFAGFIFSYFWLFSSRMFFSLSLSPSRSLCMFIFLHILTLTRRVVHVLSVFFFFSSRIAYGYLCFLYIFLLLF